MEEYIFVKHISSSSSRITHPVIRCEAGSGLGDATAQTLVRVTQLASVCLVSYRQKRMMGMTPHEAELIDVESHYPTDRIPMEMKEKSVAENLLDKMSETQ